jgi:hypothetical protein
LENKSNTNSDFDRAGSKKPTSESNSSLFDSVGSFLGMAYEKTVSVAGNMKEQVSELEITKKIVDVSGKTVDVLKETSSTVITKGTEIVGATTKIVVDKGSEVAVRII